MKAISRMVLNMVKAGTLGLKAAITKEIGSMKRCKVLESTSGVTVVNMKENGSIVRSTDKAVCSTQMVAYTLVSSSTKYAGARAHSNILMAQYTRVPGTTTRCMVMAS